MRIVSSAEMRRIDRGAMETFGIPGVVLMENAGRRVVEVISGLLGDVGGRVITILAGKGNNGGDGLVVARHLVNQGAEVKVVLIANPQEIEGDARVNFEIWQKMGQKVYTLQQSNEINIVRLMLINTDLIVDAIYGTGFRGAVRDDLAPVIDAVNGSGKAVVAVDIPSGLEADTGRVNGPCIRADHTVTFALPKLGLVLGDGPYYTGRLHVADISIPADLTRDPNLKRSLLSDSLVREWLPRRRLSAHKGDCGRVVVLAGSRGMTGAACLASLAAARSGAGLVTLGVPESLHDICEAKLTEVMTAPLPETSRATLTRLGKKEVKELVEEADVVALGPGLGTHPETRTLVRELLPELTVPVVVDADGLNALAGQSEGIRKIKTSLVLTPHPGEMARLVGKKPAEIQDNRLQEAEAAAAHWRKVVVLKGAGTVIAGPGGKTYINPTGNPGMASGGSGDVLTGIIAGLLAQGLEPVKAAACGVYIHGRAGDEAARIKGLLGMIAGDILDALPGVLKELE